MSTNESLSKPKIQLNGVSHFALYDCFNETLPRLINDGVNVDGEPRDWGKNISIYFRDPDSNQLEINFTK